MTLALINAVKEGNLEEVKNLLTQQGIDANYQDQNGCNALHYAVLGNIDAEIKTMGKAHYIELVHYDKNSPDAHQAYIPILTELIAAEVAIDAPDNYGYTPLHYAARCSNEDALVILIKAGAAIPQSPMIDNLISHSRNPALQSLLNPQQAETEDDCSEATQSSTNLHQFTGHATEQYDAGILGDGPETE